MAMAVAGQQNFQSLVLSCNKDGMDALRKGQHKAAFEQFKYAEAILIANQAEGDSTSLLAVTCNNLGCYYKKVGKLHGALSYLRRALKMEVELNTDEVTLAGTHLNICAILSKLEKHDKAEQHALAALDLINNRVNSTEADKVSQDDYSVLAIAYHNVAVERDFLNQYEKAAAAFQQGFQVAKLSLGDKHPLSIALGKNCDAVLQKSQKLSKSQVSSMALSMRSRQKADLDLSSSLPSIPGATPRDTEVTLPTGGATVGLRQEAADWVSTEESAWAKFAQTTLGEPSARQVPALQQDTDQIRQVNDKPSPTRSQVSEALREAQMKELAMPSFHDHEVQNFPVGFGTKTAMGKVLDDHPGALFQMLDAADSNEKGIIRNTPNDYRPNRMIKGSTRTARAVRRTGLHNSTMYRDKVTLDTLSRNTSQPKSTYVQKVAAEKIQRFWRAWYKYCQENCDWMTTTWICATMIQAKWRSYHVRRVKLDKAATHIQKHVRGHLVRTYLRKHQAAVTIQRRAVGMLTRKQLQDLQRAAAKLTALMHGGLARKRVREKRAFYSNFALTVQCAVRQFIARRVVQERRDRRNIAQKREKAATNIQCHFRGLKGRKRAEAFRLKYEEDLSMHRAATKLQAIARRDLAQKRVDELRMARIQAMSKAATFMRKMWLGAKSRRRYKELMKEFQRHEHHVIVIQRYVRGCLVRLRMWREAIRAEEELWAALEIQRIWRGYQGRVKWETRYEQMWRREMAATMIQCNIRGWLARTRVNRTRRMIARSEFERARRRFRSAQRIQALVRGVQTRKRVSVRLKRVTKACVTIQKIFRGHALRRRFWNQVLQLRATMIQASVRRFLIRNRQFQLMAKVIHIQRVYRRWLKKPRSHRVQAFAEMRARKQMAAKIQKKYRQHTEVMELKRLKEQ